MMTDKELMTAAETARMMAYAPYSSFAVGAAVLTETGKVYTGCNIENASFSPTVCAERTAIFKAVSEGERKFTAIAVTGGKVGEPGGFCTPCGVCRQVLAEFCAPDMKILLGSSENLSQYTLADILPLSFKLEK